MGREPGTYRNRMSWIRWILLLALLAAAGPAQAGPRDEAKRHFRSGMELIAGGDLTGGIADLEQAYEILPHPNVLFNIGRAYLDAKHQEESLPYFQRYVDSGAPDAAEVQFLVARIERELADAATPDEPPPSVTGEATAEQIEALTQLAERLERAAEQLEDGRGRRPGGGALGEATMSAEELLAAKSLETVYEEEVVSASRQATSPLDAPASTVILTAEDIRMSGATNLPDLLRSVAGVEVMQMGSGNHNIGIRGFNARMNNKVLVLVDGRSVYMDFLGATFWRTLDVNLADIERVEVVRGPGSTLYGANAFSGVINIITRPKGERSAEFGVIGGMGRTIQGNVRYSDRIRTVGYALSVGYEQTDRFELEYDPQRTDLLPQVTDPNLAVRALRVNGGVNWLPRRDTQFALSGGVSSAFQDFYAIGL
ncbi:MAG: TonB-dependent receptor plug domain-containing protein, partial [Myxococcota bacterium]|nr:TonB-dependent receptor plug domain-containing protein [Myxococcota bacterium]